MIVVNYGEQMREAFNAGRAAATAESLLRRRELDEKTRRFLAATPLTYDQWIESGRDRPAVVRG